MIFFTVVNNINVKLADEEIIKFNKLNNPKEIVIDNVYCASLDEIESLKILFSKAGKKFGLRVLKENIVKEHKFFPMELGVKNNEYNYYNEPNTKIKENEDKSFLLESNFKDLKKSINNKKNSIKIALFGGLGRDIGEMIASATAARILYEYLSKKFKTVVLDVYIEAAENKFYERDKEILQQYKFFSTVLPMGCSVKRLIDYDYYFDTGSISKTAFYDNLGFIDGHLYKFGLDYKNIPSIKKYNEINLSGYKPSEELKKKIESIKKKGKILLFHPYSADINRSMPEEITIKFLLGLNEVNSEYNIVSCLKILGNKYKTHTDLSKYSKNVFDFIYIISNADAIICVDTSVYHISEALFIPTVSIFADNIVEKRLKYYQFVKPLVLKDKKKNLSKFIYEDDSLTIYKFQGWKELNPKKLLKLIEG